MKFKKYKTLNESIAEVSEKDQGVVGPVYADAIRQAKKVREAVAKTMEDRKIEMPNEDRFAHTKEFKGTKDQKEMHLTEGVETADGDNIIAFAEEPIALKNIIVKDDNKGNLTYVKEDGTQVDLKGLDFEEVDLTKDDLVTNQKVINKEKLDNFIKSVDELPPVVVVLGDDDKYHILDGNHRSVAFITAGREVPAYSYLLSEIEEKLADEGIEVREDTPVTSEIKDGLTEQKWLTIKDMEVETPDGNKIKVSVTAPASVIMAVEKDDANNGIDSGLYDRDGLILDDYFLMMESESGLSSNKYQDYLKAMGKHVDEEIQDCQKFPIDFKKAKILNEKGLTEGWDREGFKSEVYKALADIAFNYHQKGVDLTDKDFALACDWFTTKFADEAEWSFDTSLEEEVEDCQKYPIEKPEAKDSQFYSAEDKQPELHINAKDSQFISAGDKDPRSAAMKEELTERWNHQYRLYVILGEDEEPIGADEFENIPEEYYDVKSESEAIKKAKKLHKFIKENNFEELKDFIGVQVVEILDDGDEFKTEATYQTNEEVGDELTEASFKRTNGELFAKPNRGSLFDVIQLTLGSGEWGYIKSEDGTITPTLLPHLSLDDGADSKEIGANWDKEDRFYIQARPTNTVKIEDIKKVADQFHREAEVITSREGTVVRIYIDEDKDTVGNYVGDDYPVNKEGVKGRGTGKRGNPTLRKDEDLEIKVEVDDDLEEEIQQDQKFPVEHKKAPVMESVEVDGIDLTTYECKDPKAQEVLDKIKFNKRLDQFRMMLEDQYLDSLTNEELENTLVKDKDRWLDVLNIESVIEDKE